MEPMNDYEYHQNNFKDEEVIFDDEEQQESNSREEFKRKLNSKLQTGFMIPSSPYQSPIKKHSTTPTTPSTPSTPTTPTHNTPNTKLNISLNSSYDESLSSPSSPNYTSSNITNMNINNSPNKKEDKGRVLKKSASEKFHIKLFKTKQKKDKKQQQQQQQDNNSDDINSNNSNNSNVLNSPPPNRPLPSPIQSNSKSFSVPKLPISPSPIKQQNQYYNQQSNGSLLPELSLLQSKLNSSFDNGMLLNQNQTGQIGGGDSNESTSHSLSDGRLTPESDQKLTEIASRAPLTPRLTHESKSIPNEIKLKIIFFINNDINQQIEKLFKFSPCSTIDESLSIIIPNLMVYKGLQTAKHTISNGEWESETINNNNNNNRNSTDKDRESLINQSTQSFSLFKPIDDDMNIDLQAPLHKECTIIELGLKDKDVLILKTIVLSIIFVKIIIPNFSDSQLSAQATLKLNQFTSVRSIIRKLYLKFHKSIDVSSHAIFLVDPIEGEMLLEEDELFSSYRITSQSQLIFKKESESEVSLLDTSSIMKSLKLKILISTLFSRYNYLTLNFDPYSTVSRAIKITGLRTGLLDSLNKCGFYLTPSEDDDDGFWMDEDYTLDSYHLKNLTLLEFKERCRKYSVVIKIDSNESRICTFKFDQYVKVSTLFQIMLFNEQIARPREYYLTTKDGSTLELERYLWSYDIIGDIEFKELPNKVLLFGQNGETNLVYVDFNDPIKDVVTRLSQNFGSILSNNSSNGSSLNNSGGITNSGGIGTPTRERSYTIKRLGHLINNIDVRKSLKSQGIQPNDPLILEELKGDEGANSLTNSNGNNNNIDEKKPQSDSNIIIIDDNNITSNPSEELIDEQINIWSEPVDSKENIIYSNQTNSLNPVAIEAGTLNKLIIRLTSENTHDLMFMKTLLMTYLAYTNPITLLNKLFERFQVPQDSDIDEKEKVSIQLRVGNVIKYWVEHHYEDFDHDSIKVMVDFVDSHMMSAFPTLGSQIRSYILKRTCGIKSDLSYRSNIVSLSTSLPSGGYPSPISSSSSLSSSSLLPSPRSFSTTISSSSSSTTNSPSLSAQTRSSTLTSPDLLRYSTSTPKYPEIKTKGLSNPRSLFDFDDEEIARQLTLYEFGLYSSIKPTEFLNLAWSKPNIAPRKSPTILQMINRFNNVGLWVVKLILEPERVKTRAKRMERMIKIAEKLRELKNYNTLMSFIGGLNNSAILRLKYTRGLVSKKYLDILEGLEKEMSCEGSYKSYRVLLHNTDPPCVPYIVVYLTDLTFIEEGNPNIIGNNNLINFGKYTLIYKVISEVQTYQYSEYNLKPVPIIQTFLKDLNPPSHDDLYKMSLQKEPKGAQKSDIF